VGKRGPAPQGEYENKSQVLSTRIRADTRRALVSAAEKSGRSLSQEIEHRLRRTFIEDNRIEDAFGNRRNYLLMRMIALALEGAYNPEPDSSPANWLDDPVSFDIATRCANKILEALRPEAPIPPASNDLFESIRRVKPIHDAANLMLAIQKAEPGLSLFEGTKADHFRGMVKAELGQIVKRPKIISGNKYDFAKALVMMEPEGEEPPDMAKERTRLRALADSFEELSEKDKAKYRRDLLLFGKEKQK
jgi:hypothetical protein